MQMTDELYEKYAKKVYRYLLSLTNDVDLAEELTQETFYRAIRSLHSFKGKSSLYTWLCGIAKNALATYRHKHPEEADISEHPEAVTASAEDEAIACADRIELMKRLHEIPEPQREIIYLRIFCGMSFAEISEIFEKSENWVRVNFFRGKGRLKKGVGEGE